MANNSMFKSPTTNEGYRRSPIRQVSMGMTQNQTMNTPGLVSKGNRSPAPIFNQA
jgi:hypothetical protein